MIPGAHVAAAIELLDAILGGEPAEKALTRWGRQNRFAGSKDRAAIRDHVFQALRCRQSYAARGGGLTGRQIMLGAVAASGRSVDEVFNGEGHAPSPLSQSEIDALAAWEQGDNVDPLEDLPDWLVPELRRDLGDNLSSVAFAFQTRAPLFLRVNPQKADRQAAIQALAREGIAAEPVESSQTALRVTENERRVKVSAPYLKGLCEIQDLSSQQSVESLPLQSGQKILDYCAGGGGKSLAMAAQLRTGEADFFAHDSDPARMKDLEMRAERAGARIQKLGTSQVSKAAPFDLVLVDAPCSGSGTWRRTPDAKWRLTRERLETLCQIQAQILSEVADFVFPGGVLTYATCSLLARENEDQIDRFLSENRRFHLLERHRFLPVRDGGDGFFLAIMTCEGA